MRVQLHFTQAKALSKDEICEYYRLVAEIEQKLALVSGCVPGLLQR